MIGVCLCAASTRSSTTSNGLIGGLMKTEQIEDCDAVDDDQLLAGRAPRQVRGAHDAIALLQVRDDLAAAPDVIAERDRVGARLEHLVRELRRDPDAVGEVLAVEDAEAGAQLLLQRRQAFFHRTPAGHADDVGNKKDLHVPMILSSSPSEAKA
jgi:hypothetical protein